MQDPPVGKQIKHKKKIPASKKTVSLRWPLIVLALTFVLSICFSLLSHTAMSGVSTTFAVMIIVSFILLGIIFDIVGVAVTSAVEAPFHSMSSRRVRGAKEAAYLLKHAEKVANVCNDVIGDILNIITGSMGAVIITSLALRAENISEMVISILVTAIIAALTVCGKAVGKTVAIENSTKIVHSVGWGMSFWFSFILLFAKKDKRHG